MGLIPEETISQILDRTDIVETIAGYFPLKRTGSSFKACCPFHHEKTPSFVVNPKKQIFHCFGCGVGGNVITFVMKKENMDFPEALRMLAEKAGVTIETDPADRSTLSLKEILFKSHNLAAEYFHQLLLSSEDPATISARDYLKKRGLKLETVKTFQIGFALHSWDALIRYLAGHQIAFNVLEKTGLVIARDNQNGCYDRFRGRIMFPIFDNKKRCIAFGGRAMQEGIAKYINSPETMLYVKGRQLYGLSQAKEAILENDYAVVVEGYLDAIIPSQAGIKNIVAACGTALTVDQIRLLRRYTKNVVLLFDTDQAGQSAMIRTMDLLIEESMNVKVATLDRGEDPDSFLRRFGPEGLKERILNAVSLFDYKLNALCSQYSFKTVEGKEQIAAQMLPLIAKYKNAVTRYGYIKNLSSLISVAEEALLLEMQKLSRADQGEQNVQLSQYFPTKKEQVIEKELLRLVLKDESFIPVVREGVRLTDFQDHEIRGIFKKIFDLVENKEEITIVNLLRSIDGESATTTLTELAISEESFPGKKQRMLADYIKGIRRNRIRRDLKELAGQIKQAELARDENKLKIYREKYNQLVRQK